MTRKRLEKGIEDGTMRLLIVRGVAVIFDNHGNILRISMRFRDRQKWRKWSEELVSPVVQEEYEIYKI